MPADKQTTRWPPQPAAGDEAPTPANIRWAIWQTEYKYFGDYEFTAEQHQAVAILVAAGRKVMEGGE